MADDISNKTLGEVIQDARAARGLSLRDLAKVIGKTPSYLSDIENDRRIPAEDLLRALADQLDLDFDELMARAGRLGDDVLRYVRKVPAAGVLFRKVSEKKLSTDALQDLAKRLDKLGSKDRGKE